MCILSSIVQCTVRHIRKHIQILIVPQEPCGSGSLRGILPYIEPHLLCRIPHCFLFTIHRNETIADSANGHIGLGDCRSIVFTACFLVHGHVIKGMFLPIIRNDHIHAKICRRHKLSWNRKLRHIAALPLLTVCPCLYDRCD